MSEQDPLEEAKKRLDAWSRRPTGLTPAEARRRFLATLERPPRKPHWWPLLTAGAAAALALWLSWPSVTPRVDPPQLRAAAPDGAARVLVHPLRPGATLFIVLQPGS